MASFLIEQCACKYVWNVPYGEKLTGCSLSPRVGDKCGEEEIDSPCLIRKVEDRTDYASLLIKRDGRWNIIGFQCIAGWCRHNSGSPLSGP